jgi:methanethiol S-methyltransferase
MSRLHLHVFIFAARFFSTVPLIWMLVFLHFQPEGEGGRQAVTYNALSFVGWCVLHSLMVRERAKRFISGIVGEQAVRASYVIVSGITLSLVLYFWRPFQGVLWQVSEPYYWVLTALFLACILGSYYVSGFFDSGEFIGVRTYLRAMKNRPPKPAVFTAEGPYAYCRHPLYLFFIGILWIGPVMSYGRLEFALLGTIYLLVGTYLEERNLNVELGSSYDLYRENVPMWIPRFTPWRHTHDEFMHPAESRESGSDLPMHDR